MPEAPRGVDQVTRKYVVQALLRAANGHANLGEVEAVAWRALREADGKSVTDDAFFRWPEMGSVTKPWPLPALRPDRVEASSGPACVGPSRLEIPPVSPQASSHWSPGWEAARQQTAPP